MKARKNTQANSQHQKQPLPSLIGHSLESRFQMIAAALALSALTVGCGARNTASSTPVTTGGTSISSQIETSASVNARCNKFASSKTTITGKIETYPNTTDGTKFIVKLTGLASSFDSDTTYKLQLYKWKYTKGATAAEIDPAALNFHLETKNVITNQLEKVNSDSTSILRSDINGLLKSVWNYSDTDVKKVGTTAFFNQVYLVVEGVDSAWQVLRLSLKAGDTEVGNADVLLPYFDANPVTYATKHASTLNALHPFTSYTTTSWTTTDYTSQVESMCVNPLN